MSQNTPQQQGLTPSAASALLYLRIGAVGCLPFLLIGSIAKHFHQVYGREWQAFRGRFKDALFKVHDGVGASHLEDVAVSSSSSSSNGNSRTSSDKKVSDSSIIDPQLTKYINISVAVLALQSIVILTWIISYHVAIDEFGGRFSVRVIEVDDSGW